MYFNWKERPTYVVDIETDDLDATVIHVMCWRHLQTGETGECTDYASMRDFFNRTRGAWYVGHNSIKFDGPTLVRLASVDVPLTDWIDTLVLCTLYSPNIDGGNSLAAWGERLKEPKTEFSDFSKLTPEMIAYCHQDVLVTAKLFVRMMATLESIGFTDKSLEIQHGFTILLHRQQQNGFYFDFPSALSLYSKLRSIENDLAERVRVVFPAERELVATRNMFKKDGTYTSIYLKDRERYILQEDAFTGTYNAFEDVEFNLGSPKQRVDKLKSLGWVPGPFDPLTKTGNPKPFEKGDLAPSLKEMLEENPVPEVEFIAKWMSINGRANMINTWLDNYNENDSCIHGDLFVADTLRLRHQNPNTANVPGVRIKEYKDSEGRVVKKEILYGDAGYYTYEARDLWTARPGRVLVGTDAAGLELRMLAHYINRAGFTEQVVNGDPHQYNADTVGIPRPLAKTLLYAIQYGAQPYKVSTILKSTLAEATKVRTEFLERLGLAEVMDAAIAEQEVGRVGLLDGSWVICPSPHSALNYKLQGGGARVMAQAAIFLEQKVEEKGIDRLKVGDIHDEWQADVAPEDADEYAACSVQAIRDAGEELNMNVPLDGEAKKGRTWAETH